MKLFRLNQRDFKISFYKNETLNTHSFMPYRMLHSHPVKYLWEKKNLRKGDGFLRQPAYPSYLMDEQLEHLLGCVTSFHHANYKFYSFNSFCWTCYFLHGTAKHYCARYQRDNIHSITWLASHKTGWCLFKFLSRMKAGLVQKNLQHYEQEA